MSARVFVHMGNPKAFSTSLQLMLSVAAQGQYRYLGFRPERSWHEWYTNAWEAELLNFYLRLASVSHFEERAPFFRDRLSAEIERAGEYSEDIWLSSENLSMRFTLADIDIEEKYRRLQGLLPQGTTYFVVFRSVYRSIRSIYSEYLKQGYALSFSDFCDESFLYRDANFLDSLCPGLLLQRLSGITEPGNRLRWVFPGSSDAESMKQASDIFGHACGVNFSELPHLNASSQRQDDKELLSWNQQEPDGPSSTGLLEPHRLLWHLSAFDKERFDNLVWADLRARQSRRAKANSRKAQPSNYSVTGPLKDYLLKLEALDREKMAVLAPDALGHQYDALWTRQS